MTEQQVRIARRKLNGVLLLDKPVGLSSTQAMAAAKRLYRAEKAGHTGTLDPFATGLLPICFGEAAKFSRFMLDAEKSYRATLKLGETSTTGDTEGVITKTGTVDVGEVRANLALDQFVGPQMQMPPMYSALKQDGVPLYKLARQGIDVPREARHVNIYSATLVSLTGSVMVIDVSVSKGTYVRVLAEDIGRALGCGAHLTDLRRTVTGGFVVANAHSIAALSAIEAADLETLLLPPESLCGALPRMLLSEEDKVIFCHGGWIGLEAEPATQTEHAVSGPGGDFLGVGQVSAVSGRWRLTPTRLMST
jgi:tRNA pseudouridine55 synthase